MSSNHDITEIQVAARSESSFDAEELSVCSEYEDEQQGPPIVAQMANNEISRAVELLEDAERINDALKQTVLTQDEHIKSLTAENLRLTQLLDGMNGIQKSTAHPDSDMALVPAGGGSGQQVWELASLMEALAQSEREKAGLSHEYSELESRCQHFEDNYTKVRKENAALKRTNAELRGIEDDYKKLQMVNDALRSTVKDLTGKLSREQRDDHELLELRASSTVLTTRCAQLTEEKRISDERLKHAEATLAQETAAMFILKAVWQETTARPSQQLAALEAQLADLSSENRSLTDRLAVCAARNDVVERSLDLYMMDKRELLAQTGRLKDALREAIDVSEDMSSLMQHTFQNQDARIQEAWSRCRDLQKENQNENQEWARAMSALRVQKDSSDARATILGNDVCRATVRLRQAQSANAALADANAHFVGLMDEHNTIVRAMQLEQNEMVQLLYAQQIAGMQVAAAARAAPRLAIPEAAQPAPQAAAPPAPQAAVPPAPQAAAPPAPQAAVPPAPQAQNDRRRRQLAAGARQDGAGQAGAGQAGARQDRARQDRARQGGAVAGQASPAVGSGFSFLSSLL